MSILNFNAPNIFAVDVSDPSVSTYLGKTTPGNYSVRWDSKVDGEFLKYESRAALYLDDKVVDEVRFLGVNEFGGAIFNGSSGAFALGGNPDKEIPQARIDTNINLAKGFDFNVKIVYLGEKLTESSPAWGSITDFSDSTFKIGEVLNFGRSEVFAGTFEYERDVFVVVQDGDSSYVYGLVAEPNKFTPPEVLPSLNTESFTVCFLEGTRIGTPEGERAVESLAIGDLVLTADGRAVPVKWVGRQTIRNNPIFASPKLEPVCISAGALGDGLPNRDLFVTAAHGMIWEGLVVNAGALVNGTTIRFVPLSEMPETFTWYHIETEGHEEILAHGAATETFVDYVGRRHFDNHQEYLELYGAERIIPEMKRPRVSSQRMLPEALRARLGLPSHEAEIATEAEGLIRRLRAA